MSHLIFFDGECPLCHRAVRFILSHDKKKRFLFASLAGETAKERLKDLTVKKPELDTLVLMENFNGSKPTTHIEGKAALRVLWYLDFPYSIWGVFSFCPTLLVDALYRLVAKYRHILFREAKTLSSEEFLDRLLP